MKACELYIEKINLYLDDMLKQDEIDELFLHLKSCDECKSEYEALKELKNELSLVPTFDVPGEFINDLMQKINAPKKPIYKNFRAYFALAAAIVLIFSFKTLLFDNYNKITAPNLSNEITIISGGQLNNEVKDKENIADDTAKTNEKIIVENKKLNANENIKQKNEQENKTKENTPINTENAKNELPKENISPPVNEEIPNNSENNIMQKSVTNQENLASDANKSVMPSPKTASITGFSTGDLMGKEYNLIIESTDYKKALEIANITDNNQNEIIFDVSYDIFNKIKSEYGENAKVTETETNQSSDTYKITIIKK